jgi:CheY-like chemotaxis protein
MVVDDDPLVRAEMGRALQCDGYSITEAATSMDCLRLLDAGATFDLLITKVLIPPPHGFALGRMARQRNPSQKILYLSDAPKALPDSERDAANGPILGRPIYVAELFDAVQRAIASKEA